MSQSFKLTPRQEELCDLLGGPARHCLSYGGSRSGKTFGICYAIAARAVKAPGSRQVVFRKEGVAVKQSIGMDTMKKVLKLRFPGLPYEYLKQDGLFTLGNGSEIWLAGLDDSGSLDKVLGKEFVTLYFNEASEIPYSAYLTAKTRLAQVVPDVAGNDLAQKVYVDLNPTTRAHWTYRLWVDGAEPESGAPVNSDDYALITMNPKDNSENLSLAYLEDLQTLPERQRRRFWDGEFTGDDDNALWRRDGINKHRVWRKNGKLPVELKRVLVAIDPAISTASGSDETGIIAGGLGADGDGYVLDDDSGKFRPEEWARRAISLYDQHDADAIVVERNQGGDMVPHTLRSQGYRGRIIEVTATKGKATRAEPVAGLYERGKVHHVGEFSNLEDQMCSFTLDFDRKAQGYSPDRVDALVWLMTALFEGIIRRRRGGDLQYPKGQMIA